MAVEPRVRRLIASHLGVDPGALAPDEELRLDAPALRDVTRELEKTFSIELDDPDFARLRSCRDLSMLVARRVARRDREVLETPSLPVWVRVISSDASCPVLERLVTLTPYMVETIVEDVGMPGRGRRLEVIVGPTEPARSLAQIERLFAGARASGLSVEVHRGPAVRGERVPRAPSGRRREPA